MSDELPRFDMGEWSYWPHVIKPGASRPEPMTIAHLVALVGKLSDEQILALGIDAIMIKRFNEARRLPVFSEPEWEHRATIDGIEETERRRATAERQLAESERGREAAERELARVRSIGAAGWRRHHHDAVRRGEEHEAELCKERLGAILNPPPTSEVKCASCHGKGVIPILDNEVCEVCHGSGVAPTGGQDGG